MTRSLCLGLTSVALVLSLASSCSNADPPPPPGFGGGAGGSGGATDGGAGDSSSGGVSASGGNVGQDVVLDVGGGGPKVCLDPTDPTDSDGDTIADQIEGEEDPDGDGKPNSADDDSDGDGVLDSVEALDPGQTTRDDPCAEPADTDSNGRLDFLSPDSDNDGLLDGIDTECPTGTPAAGPCRQVADCDADGVIDVVDVAASGESGKCDGQAPPNAGLYFVVPFGEGEQKKRFSFSTGVKEADIYFLVDTTASMQPAIDNIKTSLDTTIIPKILNGDPTANPPIPAIPGAWVGVGDFKDIPWLPWGSETDDVYRWRYDIPGVGRVVGDITEPANDGGVFAAPENVRQILGFLTASGGGDGPESTTQALWMAASTLDYRVTGGGGPWPPNEPSQAVCGALNPPQTAPCYVATAWQAECDAANRIGRACFRPGKLPVFAIITDAAFHNGPSSANDYAFPPSPGAVLGARPYTAVVQTLNAISAKVVGVSVDTGLPGQARYELGQIATATGSEYAPPGGAARPLVTAKDTTSGNVSDELVRLIGLLAGQGLNNVTTVRSNYSCAGNVDCDGDNLPDPPYENPPPNELSTTPFDALQLIRKVSPVAMSEPTPYISIDAETFYGIRGEAIVEFEVTALNSVINPMALKVFRVLLKVQTPSGQALGGVEGVKMIYLVVPPSLSGPA